MRLPAERGGALNYTYSVMAVTKVEKEYIHWSTDICKTFAEAADKFDEHRKSDLEECFVLKARADCWDIILFWAKDGIRNSHFVKAGHMVALSSWKPLEPEQA